MKKAFYTFAGIYVILYITILSQSIVIPKLVNNGQQVLFDFQWYVPVLFLLPLLVPKLMRVLDKVTNVKAWTIGGLIVTVIFMVLHLTLKGGLWWSWPTVGLLFLAIILTMNLTKDKITSGEGFLLGCGCALVAAGAWEIVYQTGLVFYHNYFGDGIYNFYVTAMRMSVWVLTGIIILTILLLRHKGLAHINGAFATSIALFVIFTTVWFANGMYIYMWWHEGAGPFLNEPNLLMTSMIKGSKAFFSSAPVMFFIPKREG